MFGNNKEALTRDETMNDLMDENVIQNMVSDLGEQTAYQLVGFFIDEIASFSIELESAFKSMNLQKIESITHILKNSAALYGATSLSAMALSINNRLCTSLKHFSDTDIQLLDIINQTLKLYKQKYKKAF